MCKGKILNMDNAAFTHDVVIIVAGVLVNWA